MNKSLLIVICDFLILSLFAIARFDRVEQEAAPTPSESETREQQAAAADLLVALEQSLAQEQSMREDLDRTLNEQELGISERDRALAEAAQQKATLDAALEAARLRLESEEAARLAAEARVDRTREEVLQAREDSAAARERLRLLQDQLAARERALEQAESARIALAEEKTRVEAEMRRVSTDLQIREAEKSILESNLVVARTEIETVRVEKERLARQTDLLAQGVVGLVDTSAAIKEEIRRSTPLSPNAVFSLYNANRVNLVFREPASGRRAARESRARGVLVTDESSVRLLFQAMGTPLEGGSGGELAGLEVWWESPGRLIPIEGYAVWPRDSRILQIAIPPELPVELGLTPFPLTSEPLRFPEAVLVGPLDRGYGEAAFKVAPRDPGILIMDRGLFKLLFGDFSPSRGDLVFSKLGQFMGFMVDNTTCLLIPNLDPP